MPQPNTILTIKVSVPPELKGAFADLQAKFHRIIAVFPGFISLEIVSQSETEWTIVQRFKTGENLQAWLKSAERKALLGDLKTLLRDAPIQESESASNEQAGITEVFVTQVNPENDAAFRKWIAKVHQVEAQFPGFQGVYVQSPGSAESTSWITLLQFDTPENLDRWIKSPQRQEVLKEAQPLIASIETHRVISSYAGWFSSIAKEGKLPPVWKQTMLVLLVLFPIVMLELKFLAPLTATLSHSLATFIGNALSVTLISWPMMPIAIRCLGWWLSPTESKRSTTLLGTAVVLALYLFEILLLWHL